MLEFLIAAGFFGSILFSVFLRRLDRNGGRMSQFKKMIDLHSRHLEELALKLTQSIKDASLDYELLIRQGRQAQAELKNDAQVFQEKIQSLKEDRQLIESIGGELTRIAGNARLVGEQVEHLDEGLHRLEMAQQDIEQTRQDTHALASMIENKGREAESRLGTIISQLSQETEERTRLLTEQIRSSLLAMKDEENRLAGRLEDQGRESDSLNERIVMLNNRLDEKWALEGSRVEERLAVLERKMSDRIASMESGLAAIRAAGIESVQSEVGRIRHELDSFNLEAISKRDEILNETRRMAQGIGDQITLFQEKYLSAENKLLKHAEQQKAAIREKMDIFEKEWTEMEEKRVAQLEEKLSGLEEEINVVRDKHIDDLGLEMKQIAADHSAKLSREIVQGQESIRVIVREEERALQQTRDEVSHLRENLEMLGMEMKATLRSETEHSLTLLKDGRKMEEEHLSRGQEDLQRIREELQERLESIDSQFREVSKMRQKIEESAQRAKHDLEESRDALISDFEKKTSRFITDMAGEINREVERAGALKNEVLREIQEETGRLESFREKIKIVSGAEQLVNRLDEAVQVLTDRLKLAREENSKIEDYVRNFEQIRFSRKEMESELRLIESQRGRLSEAEERFLHLEKQLEGLDNRFAVLSEGEKIADQVEDRVRQIVDAQALFDKYFHDMNDRKNFIEKAVRYIEKARQQAKVAHENADKMLSKVERAEMRQEEMEKFLQSIESRTVLLTKMDGEIQKVESRFEQMDGLMADFDAKQKQIGSMARKVDEIKGNGQVMKEEMESLISEADEKMERLSAFYQTIEGLLDRAGEHEPPETIAEKTLVRAGKSKRTASGIPDWKKDGILQLYLNHKWDADLIAERMKIDPSVVRAVIASHS